MYLIRVGDLSTWSTAPVAFRDFMADVMAAGGPPGYLGR